MSDSNPSNDVSPIETPGSGTSSIRSTSLPDNPWSEIMANAPPTEQGIKHTTLLPLPPSLEPPGALGLRGQFIYLNHGVHREQNYQMTLLPYLLAVDPNVTDKSYLNILQLSYERWGQRVTEEILAGDPMLQAIEKYHSSPPSLEELQKPDTQLKRLVNYQREVLEEWNLEYAGLGNPSKHDAAQQDHLYRQINMVGKAVFTRLKKWTKEWEEERAILERRYFESNGNPRPVENSGPKFDYVTLEELLS